MRTHGRAWVDALVVLYALPNGRETTRIGIAASKKLGKAVVRNKVKRRLREAMKLYRPRIAEGWDLVFAARGRAADTTFQEICRAVYTVLGRAGLVVYGNASQAL